jgi:UDP-N-acetylmuramate: L-alanyl-gamma-D-glutamyl-meso-diaminopimelate ligase
MKIHFIAIGGSAMHNLAIALKRKGYEITGSDDEIFEPSKSKLEKENILPAKEGWFPEKINSDLDAVILGMHARADNPELVKAKELNLKIFSYPEYIYEQTKNKTRVVIGGSHGKTTITSMIMHVLNENKIEHDYLVGAMLQGYDCMVRLSDPDNHREAKIAIIEGDEYLSSPIDRRPKFHLYFPDIAVISGIAWDHINVFPTFENYTEQFQIFTEKITEKGILVYCEKDAEVKKVAEKAPSHLLKIGYGIHVHETFDGETCLIDENGNKVPLQIFGDHNLQNLNAAKHVCTHLGISPEKFYQAIRSFKGASKRLELIAKNKFSCVYKDFAHSPSKLKATTEAVKKQFPNRKLVACMELHTFSSLNESFLEQYHGSMELADEAIVYFNPHTIEHKKLKPINADQVKNAFGGNNVEVITDSKQIAEKLKNRQWENCNLLLMTSGNFDGMDLNTFGESLLTKA